MHQATVKIFLDKCVELVHQDGIIPIQPCNILVLRYCLYLLVGIAIVTDIREQRKRLCYDALFTTFCCRQHIGHELSVIEVSQVARLFETLYRLNSKQRIATGIVFYPRAYLVILTVKLGYNTVNHFLVSIIKQHIFASVARCYCLITDGIQPVLCVLPAVQSLEFSEQALITIVEYQYGISIFLIDSGRGVYDVLFRCQQTVTIEFWCFFCLLQHRFHHQPRLSYAIQSQHPQKSFVVGNGFFHVLQIALEDKLSLKLHFLDGILAPLVGQQFFMDMFQCSLGRLFQSCL